MSSNAVAQSLIAAGFAVKPAAALAALAITLGSMTALVRPVNAQGTVYWDINGATPGAGGTTPTGTWDAANTNWSSSAAGDVDTAAWTAGDTGVFAAGTDATGTYTVTVSGTQDIGGLTFQEGTVTLSGGSLRMVANSIFDVATGRSATLSDTLTLSNDVARTLTKTGSGTLTVGTSRTYTGETIVNAGKLILRSTVATYSSPLTINSNGIVELNGITTGGNIYGNITVNAGGLLSLGPVGANVSIRASTLILNGGTVARHTSHNGLSVMGTITAAGETISTITAPFIALSNNQTINIDVKSASTLQMSGGISPGAASGVKLTKHDVGTLIISNASTYQGLTTVSAGVLNIRNNSALGTTAAGTTVTSGAALEVQGGITVGAEALALNGAGITSGGALRNISGVNTYGGAITLGSAARINSDAGTLTLNVASGNAVAGAHHLTFGGAGDITVADAIATATGGLTKDGAGTLTLSASNSYQGNTTINFGTLRAEHANSFGAGAIVLASNASLDLNNLAIANGITNNGGTISGLAGYAGTQNVLGLTALTGTVGGTVNVGIGGTLKGTNTTFSGAVAIADDGIHSPGNSPGVQTFENGISYDVGSTLIWELVGNTTSNPGTAFDLVNVTGGNLSIADGALLQLEFQNTGLVSSTVNWSDDFWNVAQSWTIIDFSSAGTSSGNFTLLGSGASWLDSTGASLATARNGASFQVSKLNNDVVLSYVIVVPEPGTLALAGIGIAAAAWAARRRKTLR
jgi:fibronectin-binding autotransporter adhesin